MKAVIYARYSSDNQREESIEGQIRECTALAEKNDITILRHYIDRAFSVKTDNRPEFQNMIRDSAKHLFDAVIVWKLDPYEILFKVDLFTGLRSGEILGLTWDCVNFKDGTLFICKQLCSPRKKGQGYSFGTLKNDKPRTITPAPYVMKLLQEQRIKQATKRLAIGELWDDGGFPNLVFTSDMGGHLSQPTVWKMLHKVLSGAGIEHFRFHDLRHTYAVNSLRSGDDVKTVQENLGHHTAAFTLDKYGHVTESMKRDSADRMEAFIKTIQAK